MRWYSVKKYIPLMGSNYLVTDSEFSYIAKYKNYKWIDEEQENEIGGVTHFCIIDPVEIDE